MRESKGYQLMLRENTIEHIIALLEQQFHTEAVRALTPMLQNIDDLERLKELLQAPGRSTSGAEYRNLHTKTD